MEGLTFAGGITVANTVERLLLYTVGGEQYATPLDDLREVLDAPWPSADGAPPVFHGRAVELHPLNDLLDAPEDRPTSPSGRPAVGQGTRPMLVVRIEEPGVPSGPTRRVGLLVDRVQGMLRAETVLPVPDGVTRLPDGAIMGAVVLRRGSHEGSGPPADGKGTGGRANSTPAVRPEDAQALPEPCRVVLLLDLRKLAAWSCGPD